MFRIPWHRLLPRHQRVTLFWILAGLGVAAPWLLGDAVRMPTAPQAACVVDSVYDGDTLRATCAGEALKIRLYCIDAPEMAQRPWGQESRDHLRRITPREVGLVERDKDRYGRIVGEIGVPAGETSINLAMVEAGQAAVYPRYCKDPAFYAAERRAREAGRGIWEKDGAQQRPWEVRR
jgi:endonuclease YncB( thermonuclease family)